MDTRTRDRVAIEDSNTQIAGTTTQTVVGQTLERSEKI
jgi:hypothetical protein